MTARQRTRSNVVEHLFTSNKLLCNGSFSQPVLNLAHDIYRGVEETTNDVVTPDFHQRIARGEIVNNPFYNIKRTYDYSVGTWRYDLTSPCSGSLVKYQDGNGFYSLGTNKQLYLLEPTHSTLGSRNQQLASLENLIQTRALANVVPADVQILVDLYEWKQTLRLVRDPVRTLYKWLTAFEEKNLRRKRRRKAIRYKIRRRLTKRQIAEMRSYERRQSAKQLIEAISSKWLAARYGVMPLCHSIQGGLDIVRKPQTSPRITARSSGSTTDYVDSASQVVTGYHWNSTLSKTTTSRGTVRAYVLYEHQMSLVERSGLSLHELPISVWEGIPFSFVVDWFLNVGDWIRAVTPKAGVNVLATGVTVRKETEQRVDVTGSKNSITGYAETTPPDGWFSRDTVETSRQPGIQANLASKFPLIDFSGEKDWVHLLDAISLVTSKLDYR